MDAESEKKMVALLTNRFNRWWNKQKIDVPKFRRRDFKYLLDRINDPKSITIIGPRQVGKTTVINQIIYELIEKRSIDPKRVLYVQLDDVEAQLLSKENLLVDILGVYQKYILMEDLNLISKDVYIFLDEVQKANDWAEHVKALHTVNKKIHIIATGSAGFDISQKNKETLPGRSELYTMFPLKFIDAIKLYYSRFDQDKLDESKCVELDSYGYELRAAFAQALEEKTFSKFFPVCQRLSVDCAPYESAIMASVIRYFSKGGYPEVIITNEVAQCQKLLRGYSNDIIVKDLMPWFKIRDFSTAQMLLFLLASISGEQMNVNELLKRMPGSNVLTVNNYIHYFESLNILRRIPVYSGSKLGSTKHPKVYFLDVGLRNALLGVLDSSFSDTEKGHLAETAAFDHVLRLSYKLNESSPGNISCFLSEKGEVDFVLDLPRYSMKLPVEIKFRENPDDLAGVYKFLEITKSKMALVVTTETLDLKGEILFMPMWMFLLMC